jgi:hypothetical protein
MKSSQNISIVLLLLSAAILTALLVGMHVYTTPQAQAGVSIRHPQSSYIVTVGHYSNSYDWIYIVDIRTRKMNAYFADPMGNKIRLLDTVDLNAVFQRAKPPTRR